MHNDVIDLREFYHGSLGQMVRRLVRLRLRELWPTVAGQRILGLGYAVPFLRPFREDAERVFALMPAGQGVVHWPPEGPSVVSLVDETELPLPDMSIDRVLLVHGLEGTGNPKAMLREIWRVLAGGGRLIVIVPNRRGIWARIDSTPFGHGSPFSLTQLRRTLRASMFIPEREVGALYLPPVRSRFLVTGANAWEKMGARWFRTFAGVHVVEASKQIYATTASEPQRSRRRLLAPAPAIALQNGQAQAQQEGEAWPSGSGP